MELNKEKELEKNLKVYRTKLTEILGQESSQLLIRCLVCCEFGKRLLAKAEQELNEINNQVEVAAAKQYPKDTEYNIIGVVNQYIKALRRYTEQPEPGEKFKAFSLMKICEKSIYANYGEKEAEQIVGYAIQKDAVLANVSSLKSSVDVQQQLIKKITNKNKAASFYAGKYVSTYYELDDLRKQNLICQRERTK